MTASTIGRDSSSGFLAPKTLTISGAPSAGLWSIGNTWLLIFAGATYLTRM